MKQYSNGGTQPQRKALGDGCPNSQPVCQLVDAVTEDDEPGQWLDVAEEMVDTPETTFFLLTIFVMVSFFLFLLLCVALSMLIAVLPYYTITSNIHACCRNRRLNSVAYFDRIAVFEVPYR